MQYIYIYRYIVFLHNAYLQPQSTWSKEQKYNESNNKEREKERERNNNNTLAGHKGENANDTNRISKYSSEFEMGRDREVS